MHIATDLSSTVDEPFHIALDLFDGPLDLLLHLVKLNELPVEQISLGLVAQQFLACLLSSSVGIEVEVAGEYLVIASTLLSIKAKFILRDPAEQFDLNEESLLEEDPHEVLVRRLQEFAVYKEGAENLAQRPLLGVEEFAISITTGKRPISAGELAEHDPMSLGKALRAMVKRRGIVVPPLMFVVDPISVSERMRDVLQILTDQKGVATTSQLEFEELVDRLAGITKPLLSSNALSSGVLISCFLAILELCRRSAIVVEQDKAFERLYLMLPIDAQEGRTLLDTQEEGWKSEFDGDVVLEVLEGGLL
jgi:segregation and condensation protein A